MNTQVANDMLELAELCGWDKRKFADMSDFIVNRLLLVKEGPGLQRPRTNDELRPYIFQLEQAGAQLQPVSREDACQYFVTALDNPFLADQLLDRDDTQELGAKPHSNKKEARNVKQCN